MSPLCLVSVVRELYNINNNILGFHLKKDNTSSIQILGRDRRMYCWNQGCATGPKTLKLFTKCKAETGRISLVFSCFKFKENWPHTAASECRSKTYILYSLIIIVLNNYKKRVMGTIAWHLFLYLKYKILNLSKLNELQ